MSDIPAKIAEAVFRLVPIIVNWYEGLDDEEKRTVREAYEDHSARMGRNFERLKDDLDDKFPEEEE